MTTSDFKSIIEALRTASLRRLDLSDDFGASSLLYRRLERAALESYQDEISGLSGPDGLQWLMRRMARIEASLAVLQAALLGGDAAAAATPEAAAAGVESEVVFEPRAVSVDMDENVVQTGFYHHENLPSGRSFRWLGPDPLASVYLPRIDGPVRVVIRAMKAFDGVPLDETRVCVDGGEWTGVAAERDDGVLKLTATPRRGAAPATSTTRVDIDCIRTASPEGGDTRLLGIAIYGVDLEQIESGAA